MATVAVCLNIEEERIVAALEDAGEMLDQAAGEVVLDFLAVRRIDSSALRAIEALAVIAERKSVKVVLRSVNVKVYKVLKLVKLARRFSFTA